MNELLIRYTDDPILYALVNMIAAEIDQSKGHFTVLDVLRALVLADVKVNYKDVTEDLSRNLSFATKAYANDQRMLSKTIDKLIKELGKIKDEIRPFGELGQSPAV